MKKDFSLFPAYEKVVKDFKDYLNVMGYASSGLACIGLREFLWRMEKGGKRIDQINGDDLKKHYQYLLERPNYTRGGVLSLHTVQGYMSELKLFFSYTQKMELTVGNPMGSLHLPAVPKTDREVLSQEEIGALYRVCKTKAERALLGLFYGCGLRKSEAERLDIRDVDLRGMCLYVRSGKGRKRRVIPLSKKVSQDFEAYRFGERLQQETRWTKREDRPAFMLNKIGTRMRGNSYWKSLKELLKRTPIQKSISLHHLRHSIATHLLSGGMRIEQVRDFLGHEYLETTQIYTRVGSHQLDL